MKSVIKLVAAIAATAILGACASKPEDIATAYVSPLQYQNYSCDQMRMELARVSRHANDLHGTLKKTASDDQAQTAIGVILFFPALFFLEGGDGPQAQEYARLKGERDALERAAIEKNCSIEVKTEPPADMPKGG